MRIDPFYLHEANISWPTAATRAIAIEESGLVLGVGTVLARMTNGNQLALEADKDRLLALLSVAYNKPASPDILHHVKAAAHHWHRGDKALANLRLTFSHLPKLDDPAAAYRMRLAEYLLDEGLPPHTLMKELRLDVPGFRRTYDPDEPRVGPGNGQRSGEWDFIAGNFATTPPNRTDRFDVAIVDNTPEDEKTFQEHEAEGTATQQEEIAHGHAIRFPRAGGPVLPLGIGPGPFAGKSVIAGPGARPTPAQQYEINAIGRDTGCHTCGTTDPGTKSGNFIGDHQLPTAINPPGQPQFYLPHCANCTSSQGGFVRRYKQRNP